jgi:hypothetical protein
MIRPYGDISNGCRATERKVIDDMLGGSTRGVVGNNDLIAAGVKSLASECFEAALEHRLAPICWNHN